MTTPPDRGSPAQGLLALALGTAVACYFVWAALRQLTRGAAEPATEYTFLGICGAWLLYVGVRLIGTRRRVLGGVSLLALAAGAWAMPAVGPGTAPGGDAAYLAAAGALLWFALLTLVLAALAWRASRRQP